MEACLVEACTLAPVVVFPKRDQPALVSLPFVWQSLNVGTKIWGSILEVNDSDLVVSLPSGLRGFVHAKEASDVVGADYGEEHKKNDKAYGGRRGTAQAAKTREEATDEEMGEVVSS